MNGTVTVSEMESYVHDFVKRNGDWARELSRQLEDFQMVYGYLLEDIDPGNDLAIAYNAIESASQYLEDISKGKLQ
jgi:hypothetical protein